MKRNFYFDNIKGLLILCVILGHTLSICSTHYGFNSSLFKIVSFFMIPLFIFITGKFAKKSRKTPLKRSTRMLIIFIIAQILLTIYYGYILKIISPSKSILTPRFTLWYLLASSFLYLSEYIFRKYKFKYVFIISLILALGSGFISQITNFLSLTRTITSLPFFVIGYYSEEINILELSEKCKNISFILVPIIIIWFIFNQNFFLFKDTYLKYNYFTYRTPMECFLKRCLLYMLFPIFSTFIMNIMPKRKTLLASIGNKTLVIYLSHGILLKTIATFNIFINNPLIGTVITYLIVIIISVSLSYIFEKLKKLGGTCHDSVKIKSTKKQFQTV